jgi:predicted nucleotidyltransferase
VRELAQKYDIRNAYYFGSYALGSQTGASDIDIMVEFDTPFKSLFTIGLLSMDLERELQIPVDVLSLPLPEDTHLIVDKRVKCYGE